MRFVVGLLIMLVGMSAIVACSDTKGRGVNEIAADPSALNGPVTVVGVMAGMSQDPAVFGLMDRQELKCKTPNCEKIIIPVRHAGKMPRTGDEVVVTGTFVNEGSGHILKADKVKVTGRRKQ